MRSIFDLRRTCPRCGGAAARWTSTEYGDDLVCMLPSCGFMLFAGTMLDGPEPEIVRHEARKVLRELGCRLRPGEHLYTAPEDRHFVLAGIDLDSPDARTLAQTPARTLTSVTFRYRRAA